jgi:GNAT superfamily N-acetyltransferase
MIVLIRSAKPTEHNILTDISFSAKGYWQYPIEYFDIWKDELTITPQYISENIVFVAERDHVIVGYISIVDIKNDFLAGTILVTKGHWLEHLFILPQFMYQGIGSALMQHAREYCLENGIQRLRIFSDPHAKGFYDKQGAVYLGESLSSIEGRTVSVYELRL